MLQTEFKCHSCGKLFESPCPSSTRYKLKKRGYVFCSKGCKNVKHGLVGSSTYSSWSAMRQRCSNPNNTHYHRYGGRGISYDPRWEQFDNFLEDMGEKSDPQLELERIDNDADYSKANCRWATRKEQTRNRGGKRATRLYTFDGKTMCIKDWADYVGITPQSMQKRLNKGWPLERAFAKKEA